MTLTRIALVAGGIVFVAGCTSYPPSLSPAKGQTSAQQENDAKDCDHQVHSAARSMFVGVLTAWSEKERDDYVACMQAKGYAPSAAK